MIEEGSWRILASQQPILADLCPSLPSAGLGELGMRRGKRPCELGADCPFKDEYQHQLEFTHEGAASSKQPRSFEGTGRKLGGGGRVAGGGLSRQLEQGGVSKRRTPAKKAAARAALLRATAESSRPQCSGSTRGGAGGASAGKASVAKGSSAAGGADAPANLQELLADEVIDLTGLD